MVVAAAAVGWRDTLTSEGPGTPPPGARDWRLLATVIRAPGVLLMSFTNASLTAVQVGVLVFLLPLYLVEQGRVRPAIVGYLVGLSVFGRLAGLWVAGRVSERRDRMLMLRHGLLGYGLVLASLTLVTDPVLLGLWSVMIGAGAGFVAGLPTAIIGDRVAPPLHGIAIGWLRTVTDTGMLLGPLVMGALADAIHLTTPFLAAGALVCVLACWCHRETLAAPS